MPIGSVKQTLSCGCPRTSSWSSAMKLHAEEVSPWVCPLLHSFFGRIRHTHTRFVRLKIFRFARPSNWTGKSPSVLRRSAVSGVPKWTSSQRKAWCVAPFLKAAIMSNLDSVVLLGSLFWTWRHSWDGERRTWGPSMRLGGMSMCYHFGLMACLHLRTERRSRDREVQQCVACSFASWAIIAWPRMINLIDVSLHMLGSVGSAFLAVLQWVVRNDLGSL